MTSFGRYVQLVSIFVVSLCALLAAVASVSGGTGVTAGGTSLALTGIIGLQVAGYLLSVESRLARAAGASRPRRPDAEPGAAADGGA